ncbi:thioesterase-like superfamily-domain-containing protein [Hyaloraphidium curvatum]|nr:thioesterase-like superfamily-domain-containing protein [Hyaloraphidium curvatum]
MPAFPSKLDETLSCLRAVAPGDGGPPVLFRGTLPAEWVVPASGRIYGAFLIGVTLECILEHAAAGPGNLRDPVSLHAQFIGAGSPEPVEVEVFETRRTRSFAFLRAEMRPDGGGAPVFACTVVVGSLAPSTDAQLRSKHVAPPPFPHVAECTADYGALLWRNTLADRTGRSTVQAPFYSICPALLPPAAFGAAEASFAAALADIRDGRPAHMLDSSSDVCYIAASPTGDRPHDSVSVAMFCDSVTHSFLMQERLNHAATGTTLLPTSLAISILFYARPEGCFHVLRSNKTSIVAGNGKGGYLVDCAAEMWDTDRGVLLAVSRQSTHVVEAKPAKPAKAGSASL